MKKTSGLRNYIAVFWKRNDSTGTESNNKKRGQAFFAIALLVLWLLVFLAIHSK